MAQMHLKWKLGEEDEALIKDMAFKVNALNGLMTQNKHRRHQAIASLLTAKPFLCKKYSPK